jgi:hypothetical protein
MQVGDRMMHFTMQCMVTVLEIKEEFQIKCLVDCDETQTPTWFFANELRPLSE